MNVGRFILAWAARHVLALLLIILILLAARLVFPTAKAWLGEQVRVARTAPAQQSAFAEARNRFDRYAVTRQADAEAAIERLRGAPDPILRQRRAAIGRTMAREEKATLTIAQLAIAAAKGDGERIFRHYRAQAEIELLRREMRVIDALLAARAAERERATLAERRSEAVMELNASRMRWQAAREKVTVLERRPLASARNFVCRNAPLAVGCQNYRALSAARAEMEGAAGQHAAARRRIMAIDGMVTGLSTARTTVEDAGSLLDRQSARIGVELARAEQAARANWVVWIGGPVLEILPTALAILAVAILAPIFLKAVFYFLVAPFAGRRRPLRLLSGDGGEVDDISGGSAASQTVRLEPGHELLLVPEAVQSTPERADKRTKWLLRWSMPLSSLASGMVALVRIRVQTPDAVVISATDNALGEVALISIAAGSSMVMRPRALRGLLQPIAQPIRITRHWRLRHLSAWLTLQFRFLVFHGPCTLIVEGSRGVRLEMAESGRGINQAATLGFSAGLAYSVSRSEAFGAYLLGKQELFNDRFAGAGYYLYEEVPRPGAKGGPWGRGLRGLGDAALKIFGL